MSFMICMSVCLEMGVVRLLGAGALYWKSKVRILVMGEQSECSLGDRERLGEG